MDSLAGLPWATVDVAGFQLHVMDSGVEQFIGVLGGEDGVHPFNSM
jgi:hypothetical protein